LIGSSSSDCEEEEEEEEAKSIVAHGPCVRAHRDEGGMHRN
jgi:hypothetical protein